MNFANFDEYCQDFIELRVFTADISAEQDPQLRYLCEIRNL